MSERRAEAVRRWCQPWVTPDPYAAVLPDHTYVVSSVYLDSADLRLYRETLEGCRDRVKLRVRSYPSAGSNDDLPVFLELKRRRDRIVEKARACVGPVVGAAVLADESLTVGDPATDDPVVDEFRSVQHRLGLRPVVRVEYHRQAYVGRFGDHTRLTLDRRITGGWPGEPGQADSWPVLDGRVVLELKFDAALPSWMQQAIRRFDLDRRSFSKYAESISKGYGGVAGFSYYLSRPRAEGA